CRPLPARPRLQVRFFFPISIFFGKIGAMKTSLFLTILFAAVITIPSFAQDQTSPPSVGPSPSAPFAGQPNQAEMMKQMMELSKLNENHKLLARLAGNWTYNIKFWMNPDPNAKPQESKGNAGTKPLMGGRYFVMDVSGKMQMPGPDGKM